MMQKRGRMTYRSVKRAGSGFVGVKAYHTRIFQSWTSSQPKLGLSRRLRDQQGVSGTLARAAELHIIGVVFNRVGGMGTRADHCFAATSDLPREVIKSDFMPAEPIRCRRPIKYQIILRGKL